MLIFWALLNTDWFLLGSGVSGEGCVTKVSPRFGHLRLRSSHMLEMLVLASLVFGVHL